MVDNYRTSFGHNHDYAGRYVYPHDAEDIKCHKFFRDIDWAHLHLTTPPFVPNIKSTEDTHYFDEEEPISDFSESISCPATQIGEISDALKPFNREIQILTANFIEKPHNSIRLRKIDKEIEGFNVNDEQKLYLKGIIRHYGEKERKRPRDKLLRDKDKGLKVLELRKQGAFLGYTYKRIRVQRKSARSEGRSKLGSGNLTVSVKGSNGGNLDGGQETETGFWMRKKLSIH